MEAESLAQVVSRHATSLLMSLNLQRNQAQFCDCVIRERQNPSQLYPAHRCVLAASSPVLASILSSTGALVELQASCLSGSVLALILDYMYTGTLPYSHSQQHYHRLLSAACHLQMDELQETLRAWKQTEVNEVDKTNACTGTKDQSYTNLVNSHNTAACTMYGPSTCSTDTFWGHGETDTVQSTTGFLEREDHQYPANVDTWDEAQVHSASRDSCIKGRKRVSIIDVKNHYSRTDLRPLTDVSICFSVSEHCAGSRGNTGNWRQVTNLAPRDLIQTIPCTEVHKEVQRDQFHSAGNGKPDTWQRRTEGDLVRTEEDRRNSCSSSPSSPYPCCGAVPVIRHSSRAAMPQLEEVSPVPPYHPVSQLSAISSRAPFSQPASRDNDSIVQGTATEYKNHYEAQTQDYKCQKTHAGIQSLDHQNTLDQCSIKDLCYKSSTDQSDMLGQDYSSSGAGHIMKQTDEHMDSGLCHITDHCHQDHHSDTGSDSHCEEVCPKGDNKEEHSYSSRCLTELSRQDPCEPQTDPYPKRRRVEINTQDNRDTATEEEGHSADVCLPIPTMPESDSDVSHGVFERRSSVELGKISDTEITEPQVTFAMPVDNNMCDSMYSVAGQSYHGHLHYHCLPQEDTHFLHKGSDHTRSHLRYPDYSDQSSDEEEAEIFSSPGHSSPRQHFATTTDQVLLLDISAKPAELFVSYKHKSEEEEKSIASCKNDTFGNGAGNNDKQQRNEGTSAVGMDNRDRTKSGAESFNEGCIKSWVAGTTVGERKSVGNDQSKPGTDIMHKAGVVGEFSDPKEGESQTCTMTVCSPPHVPDTVQVSKSSTLSACIAPTLSASMPTNISAHLSTPLHQPFQCSLCERSFSQRGSLNRHVRSHLGVRPFPCPCCPMTFSRQYRVTEHMRVHQRCALGSDFHKPPTTSS